MEIKVYTDYEALSQAVAHLLMDTIREKPDATICVASGDTPLGAYRHMVQQVAETGLNCSQARFIGLDDWVGISPQNPGSCQYPVRHHLLGPLGIAESQIHFFDAQVADLRAECQKMDSVIATAGGLDLILVGVGLNGHIGLNEPGISPDLLCHISELAEMTIRVGQKYFDQETHLTQGITLGLGHFMAARKAVVMASGTSKAAIIRDAVHQDISPELPATILRRHPQGYLLLDEAASALL